LHQKSGSFFVFCFTFFNFFCQKTAKTWNKIANRYYVGAKKTTGNSSNGFSACAASDFYFVPIPSCEGYIIITGDSL
jgi:hypothetical protein